MYIENDKDLIKWIDCTLETMRAHSTPIFENRCPHCHRSIRYPLIARKSDIELFTKLLNSAAKVMEAHGITANLLADIRTECVIAIAQRSK